MELEPDFSEFCALLNAHHVEFVVVGAYALAFHGAPRYTGDLDVLVRPTEDNGARLLTAIAAFEFPTSAITPQDIAIGRKVIQMGVPPVQLHVRSAIDGVTWDEVWQGRASGRLGDLEVAFIGETEFIKNKRASGRLKDLADIDALAPGWGRLVLSVREQIEKGLSQPLRLVLFHNLVPNRRGV